MRSITEAQRDFDAPPGYLNTASIGLPPRQVVSAVQAMTADWGRGALRSTQFDAAIERVRAGYGSLTGVGAEAVAVGSQASALVGTVAACLPDGANVLAVENDFTSVLFPLLAQQSRGVTVRTVAQSELAGAIDSSVDWVAFSLVQSATGEVADVAAITSAAATHGVRTLSDVTQASGWLPFDASQFDVTVCSAYKWIMAPRGLAFMTVRPHMLAELTPHNAGWFAGADPWDSVYGAPLRLAADARRLDVSPVWNSFVGADVSMQLLHEVGVAAIHEHNVTLANRFREQVGMAPSNSAIVRVELPEAGSRLAAANVICAQRAGAARLTFHLYNTADDADMAAKALR